MNEFDLAHEFETLIVKFAELLTGESSDDVVNKVKIWSLYQHMNKTMPALTQHWNQSNPQARVHMKALFEEIRRMNEQNQQNNKNP